MSANRWEEKHTVVNSYNGKLFSKRKDRPPEKHNNMDEMSKHYPEQSSQTQMSTYYRSPLIQSSKLK